MYGAGYGLDAYAQYPANGVVERRTANDVLSIFRLCFSTKFSRYGDLAYIHICIFKSGSISVENLHDVNQTQSHERHDLTNGVIRVTFNY